MNVSRRKGFTLVELLIVIVVIGVLAAMMMLSSTEAVTSAKATNIINNLQAFRRAGLAYYADNMEKINKAPSTYPPSLTKAEGMSVVRYFDKSIADDNALNARAKELEKEGYKFDYGFNSSNRIARWYIACDITDARVKEKLAGRASALRMLGEIDRSPIDANFPDDQEPEGSKPYDGTQSTIYLRVR